MTAYHQMGHDSWNLIEEDGLRGFGGVVLSPVNCTPEQVVQKLGELGGMRSGLDVVLDPQLYRPTIDRGQLSEWPHFSDDVETADLGAEKWWTERCEYLVQAALEVGANSVASPAVVPRDFSDGYYEWSVAVAETVADLCRSVALSPLFTALVAIDELGVEGAPERIASFLTRPSIDRVYLVLRDEVDLRRQRTDTEGLAGACKLISLLESNGVRVMVAFSGLDTVLWKGAGASDAASGKFLNLRRFVPGRWEEPKEGGRVVPYWTDGTLITWLRELDLRVLMRAGLVAMEEVARNPYSQQILAGLATTPPRAWVGLGWRQYLRWFLDTERALSARPEEAHELLKKADTQWGKIIEGRLLLSDRSEGAWIRSWSNALTLNGL